MVCPIRTVSCITRIVPYPVVSCRILPYTAGYNTMRVLQEYICIREALMRILAYMVQRDLQASYPPLF